MTPRTLNHNTLAGTALPLNLTGQTSQPASVNLSLDDQARLHGLMTFFATPTAEVLHSRAKLIAELATQAAETYTFATTALIDPPPWLAANLAAALQSQGFKVAYAFYPGLQHVPR